ncbi:hypothetical protein EG68_03466 [Paragonimus skrjabini miyazakii]|uniref:C2H2-type domain-containing protein n=1 Tax=Paragonimus skrjabini miyazakii TaxID=59628 RepID=A0A8S9YVF1_9TREM|nr:hypothetical protein EG68_03466 [Paragonimus skrjabini miyazakii]
MRINASASTLRTEFVFSYLVKCKMPRFKATPQQFHNMDEDSEDSDKSSSESENFLIDENKQQIDSEQQRKEALEKLSETAKELAAKLCANVNVPSSMSQFQTAMLLAQAAAFAAMTAGPCLPVPPVTHPPIAPLGLAIPLPSFPSPVVPAVEKNSIPHQKRSNSSVRPSNSTTQKKNIQTSKQDVKIEAPENKQTDEKQLTNRQSCKLEREPGRQPTGPDNSKSAVNCKSKASNPQHDSKGANTESSSTFDIGLIPLAAPEESEPLRSQLARRRRAREAINCSVCSKLMRRGSLREHMEMHNNSGKFKCDQCPKTFSRCSARDKHLRTHTGEKPFVCEHCSKAYRQRVHLNEHLRSHTGIRPYVCRLCGFSLASKSLLNRHLGTHGVKKRLPDAPELWFKSNASKETVLSLAAEVGRLLTDTNKVGDSNPQNLSSVQKDKSADGKCSMPKDLASCGRKYLCQACPAGFPTVQALRSHRVTTHGVQYPHKCPQCDASFTSIKLRKCHLREKHPQVCPICSAIMPQRRVYILEAHIREVHPKQSKKDVSSPIKLKCNPPPSSRQLRSATKRNDSEEKVLEVPKWKRFKPDDAVSGDASESQIGSDQSSDSSDTDESSTKEENTAVVEDVEAEKEREEVEERHVNSSTRDVPREITGPTETLKLEPDENALSSEKCAPAEVNSSCGSLNCSATAATDHFVSVEATSLRNNISPNIDFHHSVVSLCEDRDAPQNVPVDITLSNRNAMGVRTIEHPTLSSNETNSPIPLESPVSVNCILPSLPVSTPGNNSRSTDDDLSSSASTLTNHPLTKNLNVSESEVDQTKLVTSVNCTVSNHAPQTSLSTPREPWTMCVAEKSLTHSLTENSCSYNNMTHAPSAVTILSAFPPQPTSPVSSCSKVEPPDFQTSLFDCADNMQGAGDSSFGLNATA